jgi:hypothetical protein
MGPEPTTRLPHRRRSKPPRFIAYEFLIDARAGGSTVLAHRETSGSSPEAEYDAMTKGRALFFRTLVEVPHALPRRTATPITASGPTVTDWDHAWNATVTAQGQNSWPTRRTRDGDFSLATNGDLDLATTEDFLTATETIGK